MRRILIVDSDTTVRGIIAKHARTEGYEVAETGDCESAISQCRHGMFDLMVLEVETPGLDGFSALQTLRTFSHIPVVILSSRTDSADRIRGFELGADDYVVKPFDPQELMLRIAAILKRSIGPGGSAANQINNGGLHLDLTARRFCVDDKPISLTPKEFDLIALLMSHPNVALPRKLLLDVVWGVELPGDTRTLDTHIKQLRRAIAPYSDRIITLRGVGYRFE